MGPDAFAIAAASKAGPDSGEESSLEVQNQMQGVLPREYRGEIPPKPQ